MAATSFLDRLWPDMCACYRDAALARACLALQEQHDVDVPLLLALCLAERAGHPIGREALPALVEASAAWREAAILPLRSARREMKGRFTGPAELGLRDEIKRLELEAERLHVIRLAQSFPPARDDAGGTALAYLATRGVSAIEGSEFIQIFNHAHDAEILRHAALSGSQDHD